MEGAERVRQSAEAALLRTDTAQARDASDESSLSGRAGRCQQHEKQAAARALVEAKSRHQRTAKEEREAEEGCGAAARLFLRVLLGPDQLRPKHLADTDTADTGS